jgi:hypothetical protein
MKTLAFLLAAAVTLCAQAYTPKGKLTKSTWANSKIFPGTTRDVQVYVPAQYDGTKPACVMIFQDGNGFASAQGPWHVPPVMDSLIEQGGHAGNDRYIHRAGRASGGRAEPDGAVQPQL